MTTVRKTVAQRDGYDFVLSDETTDRMGDVVKADGWVLTNFKKNPIALFGHNSSFPIGTWSNLRVEGGKLVGKLVLASRGTSARIDELLSLIEQGILRAVSVGFIPLKSEPIDEKRPYDGLRFLKQELLECSLVSVPANPAALQMAKSLNISDETLSLAFGEHAEVRRKDATANGEHAETKTAAGTKPAGVPPRPKAKTMKTLSQRIEDAQTDLVAKRDNLTALNSADVLDLDAIEELNGQIEVSERSIAAMKASEAKLGAGAVERSGVTAPAIRRPLGVQVDDPKASDLIIRSALCHFVSRATGKTLDTVLEEKYPGHEPTALITKADATIATTTTSGWASQLVNTATAELVDLLSPFSVYPGLAGKGIKVTFNNNQGAINIPSISTDAALAGGFVLEGDPIPVGRFTTASTSLVPHKFGIITTMSKEAAKYTTPALENVLRRSILRRTAITLDGILLDATAGSTTRPAGLLNGVSAVASGFGGGDYEAVISDINALMAPFDTANAGRSMVLIMHPAQARKLAMMPGPDGTFGWADRFMSQFTVLTSTSATAARLIAVDAEDFATATGDTPQFDVSEQTTLHMSDTPLELVSAGGTVADPTRSMFQTNSLALRMILPITWKMRRSGMVQWIDGTSW
jgi:HK97 family phage prohead protease/HK97 family phage major capsid protein